MSSIFAGYRQIPHYGWLRKISQSEYESDDGWEYYDCDEKDLLIIAYHRGNKEFAWVEGGEDNA